MIGISCFDSQVSGQKRSHTAGGGSRILPLGLSLTLVLSFATAPWAVAKKHDADTSRAEAKDNKDTAEDNRDTAKDNKDTAKDSKDTAKDSKAATKPAKQSKADKAEKTSRKSDKSELNASDAVANSALDKETMALMNQGDWKGVAARLDKDLAGSKGKNGSAREQLVDSYRQGWRAFAWMFLGQYDNLKKQVEGMDKSCFDGSLAKDDESRHMLGNALIIKAMDEIGQNKLDAAEASLKQAPEVCTTDCIYNFAQAAVNGKKGQAAKAIQWSRRACQADPRFAWGYRTIGFLAQKLLKDNATAEEALESAIKIEPRSNEARDMLVEIKLARNDFDGATDVAQEGIKLEPKSAVSHFRLAQILTQQWRLRESLKELDRTIAEDPSTAKYFRNRASIKRFQKDFGGAIADQTRACELAKDKGFELAELANLNLAAGNTNKAVDNLKDALKADPENFAAREKLFKLLVQEKRYNDLVDAYKDQIARHPKNWDLHLGYANTLLAVGEKDKAIEEYKEAANLNQTDPTPHRALAAFYVQQGQFAQAAKEFTRALNIMPTSVKDLVALGFCYAETDDYMQAEAAFVTAGALQQLSGTMQPDDPSRLDVMRALAYLLYDEGRYGDASSQFETIIGVYKDKGVNNEDRFFLARCKLMRDLGPTAANALIAAFKELPAERRDSMRYGMVESLLDASEPAKAREALAEVPEANRKDMNYALYDAASWRLSGDNKKALEAISPAVPLAEAAKPNEKPMASRVLCEKARIQMNLDDIDGAIASTKTALTYYDKCYPADLLMAELCLKKGDTTGAMDASKRALDINPYYAQAYVTMGEGQLASNKGKDALESFKKAIELYPCWLDAHRALLNSYKKLALTREAEKEEAEIAQLESKTKATAPN